jgi:DNA polymerase delta subunit 1
LENNLPIDFQHYLEHHISQPIMRIFEPMMNNPKDLLSGQPKLTPATVCPNLPG